MGEGDGQRVPAHQPPLRVAGGPATCFAAPTKTAPALPAANSTLPDLDPQQQRACPPPAQLPDRRLPWLLPCPALQAKDPAEALPVMEAAHQEEDAPME